MVSRSRRIEVEHQEPDGTRRITTFEDGLARLVAHEIDHLHGVLCRDRMRSGIEPISVSDYRGTGHQWRYWPLPLARVRHSGQGYGWFEFYLCGGNPYLVLRRGILVRGLADAVGESRTEPEQRDGGDNREGAMQPSHTGVPPTATTQGSPGFAFELPQASISRNRAPPAAALSVSSSASPTSYLAARAGFPFGLACARADFAASHRHRS